jgi:dipeptidyl aminopeptidase/acylaminoacyl peptidase
MTDGVEGQDVMYHSHGARVSAFYYPPTAYPPTAQAQPAPAVVLCPGFTGTRANPLYQLFIGPLADAGYGVLVPDYRGWGDSEGERGVIYPLDQVEDVRAGLSYLETRDDVDGSTLGLFGISFGGGNATYAAGLDERVKAAVSVSGVGDGRAWLRGMRREYEWREYVRSLAEDRRERARAGQGRSVDPTEEIMIASPERRALKGSGNPVQTPLACAEAILDYRPVDLAARISPRAMLWISLAGDPVVPVEHARAMYAAATEPKKLVVLPGDEHYAGYSTFQREILSHALDWYARYLRADASEVQENCRS